MKAACGIGIDTDKTFICMGAFSRQRVDFLEEIEINSAFREGFLKFLKENSDLWDQKIREREEAQSLKVEKIFISLPWGLEHSRIVEDSIPLRRRKKISSRDIFLAKRDLEELALDWDDFCIHHFVLNYEVEGKNYKNPPLGVETKKIKFRSFLVWIKAQMYEEARSIFNNLQRNFTGFVSPMVSNLSAGAESISLADTIAVVSINQETTYVTICQEGILGVIGKFDFGLKTIIQRIEKEFLLSFELAQEIFSRYLSFKEISSSREITIKNEQGYISLSMQTVNEAIKNYVAIEIDKILNEILKKTAGLKLTVSFTGRLNFQEGFRAFLRKRIPSHIEVAAFKNGISSSFGCVRYGIFRPLENYRKKPFSFLGEMVTIYKEYF